MITVIQSDKPIAVNELGQKVLGSGYFIGKLKPNYPMPALNYPPFWHDCKVEGALCRMCRSKAECVAL